MTVGGFWLIKFFDKKNWNFRFRNTILMLLSLSSVLPMYFGVISYVKDPDFYIDIFLFSYFLGGLVYLSTSRIYQVIKLRRGHAHFPFEKVVIPVVALVLTAIVFNFDFALKVHVLYALFFLSIISVFLCNNFIKSKLNLEGGKNVKVR